MAIDGPLKELLKTWLNCKGVTHVQLLYSLALAYSVLSSSISFQPSTSLVCNTKHTRLVTCAYDAHNMTLLLKPFAGPHSQHHMCVVFLILEIHAI